MIVETDGFSNFHKFVELTENKGNFEGLNIPYFLIKLMYIKIAVHSISLPDDMPVGYQHDTKRGAG